MSNNANASQATKGTIVITGAGTGIGRVTAVELDKLGYKVFAGVIRKEEAESLKQEAGAALTPLMWDVTKEKDIKAAFKTVSEYVGDAGITALINNAGIVVLSPLEFVPFEDLKRNMEITYLGSVAVTQAFAPLVRKAPGRFIYVGSIAGKFAAPFQGSYVASKFALDGLMDSFRMEMSLFDIPVSVIEPGGIDTPLWDTTQNAALERFEKFPPHGKELYGPYVEAVQEAAVKLREKRLPASAVYDAVYHALTARKPRSRYYVGGDAKMQNIFARFLPDKWRDGLIKKFLGLSKIKARLAAGR